MADQLRVEPKGNKFAVVLEHHGSSQEMDVRNTLEDATHFAFYLARRLKLDVYYQGKRLSR
ncbi:hypothetical protein B5M42_020965 [Paenibacillus athensensis]|uniref:Uncharacterized protein n=1 Tax=Paenibacillus athensensis TaxID=1967502 RepID=A0A4Y8PZL7_9BACL|nr:hypothetical protein [Paenibacillus athensensis]MCD1261276.1 hypothetical protein [Paenibacillus athensensis]